MEFAYGSSGLQEKHGNQSTVEQTRRPKWSGPYLAKSVPPDPASRAARHQCGATPPEPCTWPLCEGWYSVPSGWRGDSS